MGPDQARAQLALLEGIESAGQQGASRAASQKRGIDIKRVDFAFKADAAVARRAQAAKADRAVMCVFGHQNRAAALDGGLPARGMALARHGGKQSVGNHACVSVLPGFNVDAREVCGIIRPRGANTQREIVHDHQREARNTAPQESFRRKAKKL